MPYTLYDSTAAEKKREKGMLPTSIAPGIVKNNCDLIRQGKVLVRIPSLDQEVGEGLGAQAGQAKITEVVRSGGFAKVRRATEGPFNMVLEARI